MGWIKENPASTEKWAGRVVVQELTHIWNNHRHDDWLMLRVSHGQGIKHLHTSYWVLTATLWGEYSCPHSFYRHANGSTETWVAQCQDSLVTGLNLASLAPESRSHNVVPSFGNTPPFSGSCYILKSYLIPPNEANGNYRYVNDLNSRWESWYN